MKLLSRRSVIAGSAAAVTALPTLGLYKDATEGGELAALIRRYWAEIDVFNTTEHENDLESDVHASATYEATLQNMIGVPARTRDDALAALGWLLKDGGGVDLQSEYGDEDFFYGRVTTSLVDAIRGYFEGRVS